MTSPPVLQSISLSPADTSFPAGLTQQYSANGAYSDGSSKDVTATVEWSSSDATIVSINSSGFATGLKQGSAVVSAALQSVSGTTTLKVSAPALVSITVTPNPVSVTPGSTQQLTATGTYTDASIQNLDTSVIWASSNSSIATVSNTGLVTGVAQGSVTITAADGTTSATSTANVTQPVLAVTSISTVSPAPLTPLYVSTVGLDVSSSVMVQLSNASGFAATIQPERVGSDGTLVIGIPIYVDPVSTQIGPGTVSLVIVQGNQTTSPVTLSIQDLPHLTDFGTNLGDISHAAFVMDEMLVAQNLNQLQAFQGAPGNTVDTTRAQATLKTLLNAVIQARADVDQVAANNSLVISNGNLADGTPVQFDQTSLDMMDRVLGVFLTQTFGSVIMPGGSSKLMRASYADTGRFAKALSNNFLLSPQAGTGTEGEDNRSGTVVSPKLSYSQAKALVTTMMTVGAATEFMAGATGSSSSAPLGDQVEALGTGFGVTAELIASKGTSTVLGGIGGVLGAYDIIYRSFAADGEFIQGLVTGDQSKIDQAVADSNAIDRTDVALTIAGLLVEPVIGSYEVLAFTASTTINLLETYHNLQSDGELENVDSTGLAIVNSFPVPTSDTQGIGIITGTASVTNTNGTASALPGLELSSDLIDVFNTVADPNGDYQLFVPLQDPGFDYSNATISIVDPITQNDLGFTTVDLTGLTSLIPIVMPTIQGTCNDGDYDLDDPDCD